MENRDIVVIGAGPAGSTAAKKMAERGQDVLLLEKDRYPGETAVCGGGLGGKFAGQALAQLPAEIVEKSVTNWLIYMPNKAYCMPTRPGISFHRSRFDRFMAEDAARTGADLRVRTLATDVKRNSEGLIVHLKDRETSQEYGVRTNLVIFADGPNTMAQRFGLGFPKARPDITAQAAIYELEWKDNPLDCFEFFFDERISPWGYGWVFPKRDILNVGVGCLISRMKCSITEYLDYFVENYKRVSHRLRTLKKIRFTADVIPLSHAHRIVGENMMVVGDAAGMVDPIWGGGIGPAMLAGSIAGQVAAAAVEQNRFDSSFLCCFEKMWKATPLHKYMRRAALAHRLFLKYSRFDTQGFLKFMRVVLLRANAPELELAMKHPFADGTVGLSNLSQ